MHTQVSNFAHSSCLDQNFRRCLAQEKKGNSERVWTNCLGGVTVVSMGCAASVHPAPGQFALGWWAFHDDTCHPIFRWRGLRCSSVCHFALCLKGPSPSPVRGRSFARFVWLLFTKACKILPELLEKTGVQQFPNDCCNLDP